jgi:hypothetical protein
MIVSSLLSILMSAALIGMLGRRDPKRLRNQHDSREVTVTPMRAGTRRLLGWLVPAPGLVLMVFGQWWAFLVWLGAMCVMGWVASQWLAIRSAQAGMEV